MEGVKKKTKKNPRGSILIKAQELTFVKALAGNNKPLRDRALKRLRKWFKARSQGTFQFVEDDFMRLWKGIFYSMWMSDKPLIQEELAESIADLVHAFATPAQAVLFVKCFFVTMGLEWFGLDQLRLNKFQMLVRRFLRQALEFARRRDWDAGVVAQLNAALGDTVLSCAGAPQYPLGLVLHYFDIFLEELAKVGGEDMPEEVVLLFLPPLVEFWIKSDQPTARSSLMTNVVDQLIHQTDVGLEHRARFTAWAQAGFPGESMDDMELVEPDPEQEPEEQEEAGRRADPHVKDPRAGHVDVLLPQIRFDPARVADMFAGRRGEVEGKMRRVLAKQAKKFADLSAGLYPFAHRHRIPRSVGLGAMRRDKRDAEGAIWEAAEELDRYVTSLDSKPAEVAPPPRQQSNRVGVTDEVRFQRFLDHGATFRINARGESVPKKRKLSGRSKPDVQEANVEGSAASKCTSTSPRWTVVESSPPGPRNGGKLDIVEAGASSSKKKKVRRASLCNGDVAGVTPLGSTSHTPGDPAHTPAAGGRRRFTLYTPAVTLDHFPFPTLYPDEAVRLSPRADPMMLEQRSPQLITRLPGSSGGKKNKSPGMMSPLAVDNSERNTPKSGTPGTVATPGSRKNTPTSVYPLIGHAPAPLANSSASKEAATPRSGLYAKTPVGGDTSRIGDDVTSPCGKKPGLDASAPGSGNEGKTKLSVRGAGDISRKNSPGVVKTPVGEEGGSGKSGGMTPIIARKKMSPKPDDGEVQGSLKRADKRKMSATGFPGKRRSLEDPYPVKRRSVENPDLVKRCSLENPNPVKRRSVEDPDPVKRRSLEDLDPVKRRSVEDPDLVKRRSLEDPDLVKRRSVEDSDLVKQRSLEDPDLVKRRSVEDPDPVKRRSVEDPNPVKRRSLEDPDPVKRRSLEDLDPVKRRSVEDPDLVKRRSLEDPDLVKRRSVEDSDLVKQRSLEDPDLVKRRSVEDPDPVKRRSVEDPNPVKRRSVEDPDRSPDRAENKVLSALVRGEEVTRRTSPRKNKGAEGAARKQRGLGEADETADLVAALPARRLSLNMVTPGKRQTAVSALRRLSMGSLVEGEGEVPSSPKRTSLRLAQKKAVRVKGRSPPALLTMTPTQLLRTPGAKAALLTSAKRAVSQGGTTPGGKKVNIALKHNVAQEVHEYHEALRDSPGIPFDAARRPAQGVLKAAPVRSPVNPFYLLKENARLNRLQPQTK